MGSIKKILRTISLAGLIVPAIAFSAEIEVFKLAEDSIIVSDATIRQHKVTVYTLDMNTRLEKALSIDVPLPPPHLTEQEIIEHDKRAQRQALILLKKRLRTLSAEQIAALRNAFEGQLKAAEYGVNRLPAVVINDRIFYTNNIDQVLK